MWHRATKVQISIYINHIKVIKLIIICKLSFKINIFYNFKNVFSLIFWLLYGIHDLIIFLFYTKLTPKDANSLVKV